MALRRLDKALAYAVALLLSLALAACMPGQDDPAQASDGGDVPVSEDVASDEAGTQQSVAQSEPEVVPEPRLQVIDATEENVRLISRTYEADGATWLAQSGSATEFAVEGTRVELRIVGGDETQNEEHLRPRFAVLLDGAVVLDDTLSDRSRTVEVFDGNVPRSAVVEVMMLSEARRGAVGVEAIVVESAAQNPVTPTKARDLSISFVGDSITCGYGVESASSDEPFKTTTENFMKSYAYLTAQALDADYETVCYSGHGIVSGWTDYGTKNEDMLLPPLYEPVIKGREERWDFAAHPHDVVVVNLGTNDFSYTGTDEARMQEFADGYADFLMRVRDCNPHAYIVCTMGTMGGAELYAYVEQAVRSFQESTGDTRISCYLSDELDAETDGIGARDHPTAITQQKSAAKLVEVIRHVLG